MGDMTNFIMQAVESERGSQEELKRAGRFEHSCADAGVRDQWRLSILAEEFGEAARIVNEQRSDESRKTLESMASLREELIQVAAVAVAWAEGLTAEMRARQDDEPTQPHTRLSLPDYVREAAASGTVRASRSG